MGQYGIFTNATETAQWLYEDPYDAIVIDTQANLESVEYSNGRNHNVTRLNVAEARELLAKLQALEADGTLDKLAALDAGGDEDDE